MSVTGNGPAATLRLADGRRVGYRIYGAADGAPVLALHGTPGAHSKFAMAGVAASTLGLRLIAIDRWGYGATDAPANPSLAGFGRDMALVADALAVEKFSVIGISGGGPYAAAVAAILPGRVTAAALVSPVGPIVGLARRPRLSALHYVSFRVLPRIPGAIDLAFKAFRQVALRAPASSARIAAGRALSSDREIMSDRALAADLGACFATGLATGTRGPAIDMQLFSRAWNVDLREVACSARVWIGDEDRNVPIAAAIALAGGITGAELTQLGPHGHYWIARNFPDVLQWLAER